MTGRRSDGLAPLLREAEQIAAALLDAKPQQRRGARGTEPVVPIYVEAVDHRRALLDFLLGGVGQPGWLPRARSILGWALPAVPLSRRDYLPCPYCLANSLWVERTRWGVFCGNPACPQLTETGRRAEWWVHWSAGGRPLLEEITALSAAVAAVLAELMDEAAVLPPEPEREAS